ncbi:hypothetical protein KI387_011831, partial [Taxus chinensis]
SKIHLAEQRQVKEREEFTEKDIEPKTATELQEHNDTRPSIGREDSSLLIVGSSHLSLAFIITVLEPVSSSGTSKWCL